MPQTTRLRHSLPVDARLHALIPDLPLSEYRPAGYAPLSAWRKLILKVGWGFDGWARRVWVSDPTQGTTPLVIGCQVETFHCSHDIDAIDLSSRHPKAMKALADIGIDVIDRPMQREATFLWRTPQLTFQERAFSRGRYRCGILWASPNRAEQSEAAPPQVNALVDAMRSNIGELREPTRKLCINPIWRTLFSAIDVFVCLTVIFVVADSLRRALPTAFAVPVVLLVATLVAWAYIAWASRYRYKQRYKVWSEWWAQGDNDGTIRRALASVGIDLPELGHPRKVRTA